jgi:hypothetical protein
MKSSQGPALMMSSSSGGFPGVIEPFTHAVEADTAVRGGVRASRPSALGPGRLAAEALSAWILAA